MSVKERLEKVKRILDDLGVDKKVLKKIEDDCIRMSHLMFSEKYIISRMNEEIKEYLEKNERYKFNFVNIAEKYDFDIEFLD